MAPKKDEKPPEEVAPEAVPADGEAADGEEAGEEEYKKELTEEQLQGFHEQSGNNEDAVKYMALEILGLPDYTYAGQIALLLDYFVGVLMFAQEEKLGAAQTLLMYKMSHDILDLIKGGATLRKTEIKFKKQLLRWSVKVQGTNHVPLLTTVELQKIVPFFLTTVFQHYKLYNNCFQRESLHWHYHEELWVETALVLPLIEADTQEEIDEDRATREAYEKVLAEYEAARLAAEAKARWDLENPPEPRRPPNNLDEAIEFAVRDKVEEVLKLMEEEYEQRGATLLGRCQNLEEQISKKK